MCSWPEAGRTPPFKKHWQYGYFNECMTGFEWQAAAHMIWEGLDQPDLLQHGLAVTRAIHDRYNAALRNPYNEIECCDHYSRAMASYGVFQAVCGFDCHGPQGHLEFAPRLGRDDFRAAFTSAEGWGTITQTRDELMQSNCGASQTRSVAFENSRGWYRRPSSRLGQGQSRRPASFRDADNQQSSRSRFELSQEVVLKAGQRLTVELA